MRLFENVSYHLSQSLAEHTRLKSSRILDSNAGTRVPVDLATHILSDTIEYEGCDTRREGVVSKRRKFANHDDSGGGKGEGLGRSSTGDSDVPPSRLVTTTKPIKRPADDNKRTGGGRKRIRKEKFVSEHQSEAERIPSRTPFDPQKKRVLTTKAMVPEQIEKAVTKLGMKFTQKLHECTHLVTNLLSRTEKFLCALPSAPFVFSMDWLKACVDSGSVVAEGDYTLQDPDMEHKHKFKLVDALRRARELKKKKRKLL